jgi:hypothetical protein
MVWDRIEHPDVEPVERWGGISYSLAAAAAALPDGWTVRPIIKVGRDLARGARDFLDRLPGLERPGGVAVASEPNNRVHLRYYDRHRRVERLSGGVPTWEWSELEPHLHGLDALYVNLISGFELDRETAGRLAGAVEGLLYVDLHSLLLGVGADGTRVPQPPRDRKGWLAPFDVIQLNEQELTILAGGEDDAVVVREALDGRARAVLETRGPDGAVWHRAGPDGDSRSGRVPVLDPWTTGDPTGCGDVWGATCFMRLVRGDPLEDAMAAANRAAARNVDHRGAEGLFGHLRDHP